MTASASPVATLPSSTNPAQLVAHLKGRVHARRRIQTKDGALVVNVVKLPAPDEYTSPQTVELRSRQPLGAPGDEWEGQVRIGGFGRSYESKDPESGDRRTVQTADNTLTVVE